MTPFDEHESNVRSYCRRWPTVFATAHGAEISDDRGTCYVDFFAAAGALNYGHNPIKLVEAAITYLQNQGIVCALDMATSAKAQFIDAFIEIILQPRQLDYRLQFTSPSGSDAVEAAIRLARKATGRAGIIYLNGSYHGITRGAASVSGLLNDANARSTDALPAPHELDSHSTSSAISALEALIGETKVPPAALILEVVQGEGGVRLATRRYLRAAASICQRYGSVFIVDDVQAGCGRTGPFFSFEPAGIYPDIVCLSKSLSGLGLPLSIVLIKPDLDLWRPAEHTGTFRGNNLAFLTARMTLEEWWQDSSLQDSIHTKSTRAIDYLASVARQTDLVEAPVGAGLFIGLPCRNARVAEAISNCAFRMHVLVETCGVDGNVIKLMPPLTIGDDQLEQGLHRLRTAIANVEQGTLSAMDGSIQLSTSGAPRQIHPL